MMYNDDIKHKKEVLKMAREKSDVIFQSVTMRIPKDLYEDYKKVLRAEGKIVTYDVRAYMTRVVEKAKKEKSK